MKPKKSDSANLENKRRLYLLIGLTISLGIVLIAFKWNNVKKAQVEVFEEAEKEYVVEEFLPRIKQPEKPKIEIPKPKEITDIEEVDDDEEVEEIEVKSSEDIAPEPLPVDDGEEEDEDENTIFTIVEQEPQFKGGYAALVKYLKENIEYPQICIQNDITGTVYVNFVVEPDGSISNVEVIKGVHKFLDREAIRVAKNMPKWNPGRQRGKAVKVYAKIPIRFSLN